MSPTKILVVEDSELLQKGYNLLFHRYRTSGGEVIRALNGKEALEQLCRHPDVDLIILDINMPIMSGLEFLYHCKRQPSLSHIPVIVSSTEGEEDDIVRGLEAGAIAVQRIGIAERQIEIEPLFVEEFDIPAHTVYMHAIVAPGLPA